MLYMYIHVCIVVSFYNITHTSPPCTCTVPPTEANPETFNNRYRNKYFYVKMGGKDLVLRRYANLTDHIKLYVSVFFIISRLLTGFPTL
jgi:hypothetical protein